MKVAFDIAHLYYLPQFTPVLEVLQRRGVDCECVFYSAADAAAAGRPDARVVGSQLEAARYYAQSVPDWVVFGNDFDQLANLAPSTRTALLYHGIGLKECYYDPELMEMDVRFVEGEHRRQLLQARYPAARLLNSGFAKLDPLFNGGLAPRAEILQSIGLDPARQTVLYAPTYYPSSIERLPDKWPEALADLNLLIKPHQFTFTKPGYAAQRRKLEAWDTYPNVHIAGPASYSIIPFMACSDILVSEASSTLFEFAALDRPIVWCDFYKLRWSYRGLMKFRFSQRMDGSLEAFRDIAAHAATPDEVNDVIRAELAHPQEYAAQRRRYAEELIGNTDGHAGERIADYLMGHAPGGNQS